MAMTETSPTLRARFSSRHVTDANTGCWLWTGAVNRRTGYGHIGGRRGENHMAHRVAYEMHIGPIPAGLQIDHLCRVRRCVNPAHLEPVTVVENLARGVGPSARAIRENVCRSGHPFSPQNTGRKTNGTRKCRACQSLASARWRAKGRDPNATSNSAKTHCPQGHPYDDANTYRPPRGGRQCRMCMKARSQSRRT
jgi:hypothetical protein